MNPAQLLSHFDRISDAPDAIPRLRQFILDLAVRGKLVEQDPRDEPASELLKCIRAEKVRLVKAGKIKEPQPLTAIDGTKTPYGIPLSWEWVPLGETVNSHLGGGTPSKNNSGYWDGDIFWASVKDVGKGKYIDETIDRITKAGLADSSSNLVSPGNLIIVTRMGLGKISINRVPIAINQDLRALSLSSLSAINYHYIFFKTHGFEGTGLTVKGIRVEELLSIAFPLPPLAEQHRIVAKVDELMALCDRLEAAQAEQESRRDRLVASSLNRLNNGANADAFHDHARFYFKHLPRLTTKPEHIQQLRHSILNLAVRGKLVPQDRNDRHVRGMDAKKISLSKDCDGHIFNESLSTLNLPSSWGVEPLISVVAAMVDCPHSTPKWANKGRICVRTNQFRPGHLDLSGSRYVSEKTYADRIQRMEPTRNDILYSREGGILGVACRIPPGVKLCLGQRMMLIRAGEAITAQFLEMVLNSPFITTIARTRTTGGAAPRVNVATIKAYPIPLPPLAEQQRIVAKVDELIALCDQLDAQLINTRTDSRRLLDAVLHYAISA